MSRKRIFATLLSVFVILLALSIAPSITAHQSSHPTQPASPSQLHQYKVYKADGSVVALTPSKQHPLIFFATWCPHCQQDLGGKTNPNAYYIDTFTRESNPKDSFKAIQNFIKTYHADPDTSRYFVSVDKQPQGVPHVPFTITQ